MPDLRKFPVLLALAALALPVAGCGKDEVRDQANKVRTDIEHVSKRDLRKALHDAEDTAKNGSGDAKREARKLERKIQRELNRRD